MRTLLLLGSLLLMSCSTTQPSYRLMCWLPNGFVFYDGTASWLDPKGGYTTFKPTSGPQAGKVINTTCACTWMRLED